MRWVGRRQLARFLAVAGSSLAAATLAIATLQDGLGIPNPSALYLVAVVATAVVSGTWGAVVAAVASFILYNFLFIDPRYTFVVDHRGELVNLFLLLFVGIVVGQLAALQRDRAEVALSREREARALFQVTRALATRPSTPAVLPTIAEILRQESGMDRVWVWLGRDNASERVAADTAAGAPRPDTVIHTILQRTPGDAPARGMRIHQPAPPRPRPSTGLEGYRVRIEAGDETYGSIAAVRPRERSEPDRTETRLLAAAADQIGQALRQDRLASESRAAEIARQSDALKSTLLQSVSHDLRTPLATIRAAAGTLRPGSGLSPHDQRLSADAIDREVEYLNRLVTNLLDLSRIEAGALRAGKEAFELDDVLGQALERLRPRLVGLTLDAHLEAPPVSADPVLLDEAFTNIVENAVKHTPPGTLVRINAQHLGNGMVRLTIEDSGPGVPPAALPRLFDKFYRVPGGARGSRSGTGIGLAVTRGLVEAMGGRVSVRRSELGGLAIDLDLPAAPAPAQVIAASAG
ncbi:MAG TPA: ATP-binding protein [Candidatus Sulfomarinibacteraceae bacterium]|nr:ATP-binding protein [Candidatus Sulfomarinibacteraceae bacterium]